MSSAVATFSSWGILAADNNEQLRHVDLREKSVLLCVLSAVLRVRYSETLSVVVRPERGFSSFLFTKSRCNHLFTFSPGSAVTVLGWGGKYKQHLVTIIFSTISRAALVTSKCLHSIEFVLLNYPANIAFFPHCSLWRLIGCLRSSVSFLVVEPVFNFVNISLVIGREGRVFCTCREIGWNNISKMRTYSVGHVIYILRCVYVDIIIDCDVVKW